MSKPSLLSERKYSLRHFLFATLIGVIAAGFFMNHGIEKKIKEAKEEARAEYMASPQLKRFYWPMDNSMTMGQREDLVLSALDFFPDPIKPDILCLVNEHLLMECAPREVLEKLYGAEWGDFIIELPSPRPEGYHD